MLAVLDALPKDALIANNSAVTFGRVQDLLDHRARAVFFMRCTASGAVGASLATRGWVASVRRRRRRDVFATGAVEAPRIIAPNDFVVFNNRRYGVLQNVARQLGYANAVAGRFVGMEVVDPAIDFQALAASMPADADEREAIGKARSRALERDVRR